MQPSVKKRIAGLLIGGLSVFRIAGASTIEFGDFKSIQVNVDPWGQNIVGDAANEPAITVDPTDHRRLAIGWRQFNAVTQSLREPGWGYSRTAGHSWRFAGSLTPGVFGSDPVLDCDAEGVMYYLSLKYGVPPWELRIFDSVDGGQTWNGPTQALPGLRDKPWMTIDRTNGPGRGYIYLSSNSGPAVARSIDGGIHFQEFNPNPAQGGFGTLAVGPDSEFYAAGVEGYWIGLLRSFDAWDTKESPIFEYIEIPTESYNRFFPGGGPNNIGILAQCWVATDHSIGPSRGNVYILVLGRNLDKFDGSLSIEFRCSTDQAGTWSEPVRVNDDPPNPYVWQWFPTMSVAPNGRIDVIWNDTRNFWTTTYPYGDFSELYYSYSTDAGVTWSPNVPVSPPFNHFLGYPSGSEKLGDYYTMVSDNLGANVAYATTFNGEQDVYFLRIGPYDCNGNEISDEDDIAAETSMNCNGNEIPDECEVPQDTTGDGRVNLADYATLQTCFTGASGDAPYDPCCARLDSDTDSDIDLSDFAAFDAEFMK